jgi:hypothetical protein
MSGPAPLVSLLARRIGHDLATPLGALQVSLELGPEPDPLAREAMALAVARLDLFRELFGGDADAPFDPLRLQPLLPDGVAIAPAMAGVTPRHLRAATALALDIASFVQPPARLSIAAHEAQPALAVKGRLRPLPEALVAVLAGAPPGEPRHAGAAFAVQLAGRIAIAGNRFILG